MRTRILVILATAFIELSSSSPDTVHDFNRITSSLSHKTSSATKIKEEKRTKKYEMKSEGSKSTLSSHIFHEGHNLFYQPQILIGSDLHASIFSSKVQDAKKYSEYREQLLTSTTNSKKNQTFKVTTSVLPEIPEAPTLSPLVMPDLPTPVIVKEHVVIKQHKLSAPVKEIIIEQDTVMFPELPVQVILPKHPHVPTCIIDNNRYGITVPCAPITVSSEVIGIQNMVEKSLHVSEIKPLLNLRLPKIPLGIVYNKPVKTLMPYPEGFISTTRFLPSVRVSKIPLQRFGQQNILFPSRTSEVIVENLRRENVGSGFSSFSAYCAHNIALERILPNIVIGK